MARVKRALLGGSFDPPHFGHLHLALTALERCDVDQILWVPSLQSPLKHPHHCSWHHRIAMVTHMIAPYRAFTLCDIESSLPQPSWTLHTLEALASEGIQIDAVIIGSDQALLFSQWHAHETLLRQYRILWTHRSQHLTPSKTIDPRLQQGFFDGPQLEISSTWVRTRLEQKLPCHHLVPSQVLDYIQDVHLYSV